MKGLGKAEGMSWYHFSAFSAFGIIFQRLFNLFKWCERLKTSKQCLKILRMVPSFSSKVPFRDEDLLGRNDAEIFIKRSKQILSNTINYFTTETVLIFLYHTSRRFEQRLHWEYDRTTRIRLWDIVEFFVIFFLKAVTKFIVTSSFCRLCLARQSSSPPKWSITMWLTTPQICGRWGWSAISCKFWYWFIDLLDRGQTTNPFETNVSSQTTLYCPETQASR